MDGLAFLTYTIELVRLTARVPLAAVSVQMTGWMVFAYYVLVGALGWWLVRPSQERAKLWNRLPGLWLQGLAQSGGRRVTQPLLLAVSAILLLMSLFGWRTLPDGLLHVVFLDVGQGDAIFIRTPSGHQVLIDGGPSEAVLLTRLGRAGSLLGPHAGPGGADPPRH